MDSCAYLTNKKPGGNLGPRAAWGPWRQTGDVSGLGGGMPSRYEGCAGRLWLSPCSLGGTREGGCGSLRGTHQLLPQGMKAALDMLRWGVHDPGCEREEVQAGSKSQGQAQDMHAGDAECLALE